MLDEMSARQTEYQAADLTPAVEQDRGRYEAVREAVAEVFQIESENYAPQRGVAAVFTGQLFVDSEVAYDRLDTRLAPLDLLPMFREHGDTQVVQIIEGRFNPRPRPWWPNALLFILTLLSLLYTGAGIALGEALLDHPERQLAEFWRGWPYALGIVLILGTHELGHYFAARRHGIPVTLPYFIPLPFGFFGTLGAFIQLRAPIRNRKAMLDVGVTGPLAGLAFAIPILLLGLLTAEVKALPTDSSYILEGNSILYSLSKWLVFGQILPDGRMDVFINQLTQAGWTGLFVTGLGQRMDVFINQLTQAGWTGLFVTGLNLIPIGQLDGGHVLYTLFGDRARLLYWPAVLIMTVLAVVVSDAWFLWVMLLLFFGRTYATPLDMLTPLDSRRRWIALAALIVFVLVFVPNPLTLVEPPSLPPMELF